MATSNAHKSVQDQDIGDADIFHDTLEQLLILANQLCNRTEKMLHIPGVNKLLKKCQAEMKFLNNVKKKNEIKKCYINSTNLTHLQGIVDGTEHLPHVVHVLQSFDCPHTEHPIIVDVVCNYGYTWIKVVARKPEALHRAWAGCNQFGEKSLTEQASLYQACAALYTISFRVPDVLFIFINGVPSVVATELGHLGVLVFGERLSENIMMISTGHDDDDDDDSSVGDKDIRSSSSQSGVAEIDTRISPSAYAELSRHVMMNVSSDECHISKSVPSSISYKGLNLFGIDLLFEDVPHIRRVNLDITTLIAFVSNLCHGGSDYVFKEPVLTQQAEWERTSPLLPKLETFIKDKELFVCKAALSDFHSILQTVGGPQEKIRAQDFLKTVKVTDDALSDRAKLLQLSHKVKQRAKIIFGTGDKLQAITMSANSGFIRAAANQGMTFAVFLHEPRALTEQKEKSCSD